MQAAGSMVREERDPVFWQRIAEHPEVRHVMHGHAIDMAEIVGQPGVLPLASAHGGMIFTQRDPFGTVYELHTLYTPEGRGREVHDAAISALAYLFGERRAALVFTFETDHQQSRAPRSFGFERSPLPVQTSIGRVVPAHLTAQRWFNSPAWRRACQ